MDIRLRLMVIDENIFMKIFLLQNYLKTALFFDTAANTKNRLTGWPEKAVLSDGFARTRIFFFFVLTFYK